MTVMAASSRSDSALMRRSMQAGARDFLVEPFFRKPWERRLPVLTPAGPIQKKALGKALVFVPSKGGVGVTPSLSFCAGAREGVRRQSRDSGHGLSTG